jgi:predicted dehydrogenase
MIGASTRCAVSAACGRGCWSVIAIAAGHAINQRSEFALVTSTRHVRFGTLGVARITPNALIKPLQEVPEAVLIAVAARDRKRAEEFAAVHGIPRVHATYGDLINDPEVDVIYNPLPNSHHCNWTIAALRAGKHVLCEKPLASNAAEAQRMG